MLFKLYSRECAVRPDRRIFRIQLNSLRVQGNRFIEVVLCKATTDISAHQTD